VERYHAPRMSSSKMSQKGKQRSMLNFFTPKSQPAPGSRPTPSSASTQTNNASAPRHACALTGQKRSLHDITPPLPFAGLATPQHAGDDETTPVWPSAPGRAASTPATESAKRRKLLRLLDGGDRQSEQFRCAPATVPVPACRDRCCAVRRPLLPSVRGVLLASSPAGSVTPTIPGHRKVESRFAWLENKNTPDGRGRRKGDPDYDERTVTVPEQFYRQLSGERARHAGPHCGKELALPCRCHVMAKLSAHAWRQRRSSSTGPSRRSTARSSCSSRSVRAWHRTVPYRHELSCSMSFSANDWMHRDTSFIPIS